MLCSGPEGIEHADLNVTVVLSCHTNCTVLHYIN